MDDVTCKSKISATFESVQKFSFEEKQNASFDEAKINKFLDTILKFKQVLSTKIEKINTLVAKIEQVTWFNNLDNEALILTNDLISSIRDLRSSLLRQYVSLNFIRAKGIAKDEIKNFKTAIDDLEEIARDLEATFFFLPKMEAFNETTKELSLV